MWSEFRKWPALFLSAAFCLPDGVPALRVGQQEEHSGVEELRRALRPPETAGAEEKINLNQPDLKELKKQLRSRFDKFVLSDGAIKQIVEMRQGGKTIADLNVLQQVRGIGPSSFVQIRKELTLGLEPESSDWTSEVQAVVEAVASRKAPTGTVLYLGGHYGVEDDRQFLAFIDRLLAKGVAPVVLLEAGPPSYSRLQDLVQRNPVVHAALVRNRIQIFSQATLTSLRDYYRGGGTAPAELARLISQEYPHLADMYLALSPQWQALFRAPGSSYPHLLDDLERRRVPLELERSSLASWILSGVSNQMERQAQSALLEWNDEAAAAEHLQEYFDLNDWKDLERERTIAQQAKQLNEQLPGRLVVIRAGYLHEALQEAVRAASPDKPAGAFAVARSPSVAKFEEWAFTDQLILRRRREGRTGRPFDDQERRTARMYVIQVLLVQLLGSARLQGAAQLIQAVKSILGNLSDQDLSEINGALCDLNRQAAWPRGTALRQDWRIYAMTFFLIGTLNERGLIPVEVRRLLPDDLATLAPGTWFTLLENRLQIFERNLLGGKLAGLEEHALSAGMDEEAHSGQQLSIRG